MEKSTKEIKKSVGQKSKTNLKQRDKLVFTIIVVAIVIAIIVCIVVAVGGNAKENSGVQNNVQSGNKQTNNEEPNVNDNLDGQIDYSNDTNVKIKDNVKENNSKALLQEKDFDGMKVKNIKLIASNGTTKFTATVENTSTTDFKNQKIVIIFKNQDGSELARLNSYLGDIKVGSTAEIDASTTSDVSNAYDFVIQKGV